MGLFSYLKSTILSKIIMAFTGVLLVLYICFHTLGNMQVYIGREALNRYADLLQSLGELLWIFRIVMLVALILHVLTSLRLKFLNLSTRPVEYKFRKYLKAKLTSRTMIWTGLAIFAFILYHILHFTMGVADPTNFGHPEFYGPSNLFMRHDVYFMLIKGFRQPVISIVYIVGVTIVGFHLSHSIQSMFQTLGFNGPRFTPFIINASNALATIIALCLISIPITVLLGLVGRNI